MKIVIDAHILSSQDGFRSAGVSAYVWQLVHALAAEMPPDDVMICYARVPAPVDLAGASPVLHWHRTGVNGRVERHLWARLALPRVARGQDLAHEPVNLLPPALPCPGVVTVHDLAFLHFPMIVSPLRRAALRQGMRASAIRATVIIAISHCTRQDLITHWGIPPERIHVVYPAIDPSLQRIEDPARLAAFRTAHDLERPYILILGTLEPRKNLPMLIDAVALARQRGWLGCDVILAGALDWQGGRHAQEVRDRIHQRGVGDCLRLVGYVPATERPLWYSGALALAMPSLYEGFGMPVAEALACGTPAVVADAGSLPEIVCDPALRRDPVDVAGWAELLARVEADNTLRDGARADAAAARARFALAPMARGTLAAYHAALKESMNASA
jgi:glycosyltransferase involved in cell wall biosynthesis